MPSLMWVSPPSSKNIVLSVPFQIRVVALTPFVCVYVHRCMEVNVNICVHACDTQRQILPSSDTAHLGFETGSLWLFVVPVVHFTRSCVTQEACLWTGLWG